MITCMNTSGMISLPQTSPQSMKKASLYPITQTFLLIPLSDPLWKSVMHLLPPDSISWNRQTTMFLNKGITGITDTIRYWETSHPEVALLGIHDSAESAGEITTISCKDVTFSLLNYTTTVNNEPYDELPDYAVDLLRTDQVISDVKKAKEISDMTIAFLHTGAEYSTEPDTEEKTFLQLLLHQGVDIAICAHSHTLQNFETLTDDSGHQMLVYYSLGNFISTQKDPVCLLGGMADITIVRDPVSDALSIRNADLVPLVTHYNHDQNIYTVYKLSVTPRSSLPPMVFMPKAQSLSLWKLYRNNIKRC